MKTMFLFAALAVAAFSGVCAAESGWGVCAHLNRWEYDRAGEELKLMKQAGIGFVRFDLDWSQVEPEPGKWNFERWDKVVELARKEGVMILPILGGDIPARCKPPYRHLDAWLAYVRACVTRYRDRLPYWEVMNEINLDRFWHDKPDPEAYATLLKATYAEIKKIDPRLVVLHSGLAGMPTEFVEGVFKAGGGAGFDVMNIHPYSWIMEPELTLPQRLETLDQLMRKYGIVGKPVWITEIGNATGTKLPEKQIYATALRECGIDPAQSELAVIRDSEWKFYSEGQNFRAEADLPRFKHIRAITAAGIATLDPAAVPVLLMSPEEEIPAFAVKPLHEYLRRGGTVIFPSGFPLYFELDRSGGTIVRRQVNAAHMPDFHLGWDAWWTNPAVPKLIHKLEPAPGFPEIPAATCAEGCKRFFNGSNLKGNDRFLPLYFGVSDGFRAPVAGLYRFDSDLKGNTVVVSMRANAELCDEATQAKLLARNVLLAKAGGVEKLFVYSFRSKEWDPGRESHFGIVRRNLEPKPAYSAYRTVIDLLPAGSTRPELAEGKDGLFSASWRRPDGSRVLALWTRRDPCRVELTGKPARVLDHLGNPVNLTGSAVEVTDAPLYLISDRSLGVKHGQRQPGWLFRTSRKASMFSSGTSPSTAWAGAKI